MNHLCLYTDCFVLFGHFYFIIHVLCIENINFLIIIFIANTFPQKKTLYMWDPMVSITIALRSLS